MLGFPKGDHPGGPVLDGPGSLGWNLWETVNHQEERMPIGPNLFNEVDPLDIMLWVEPKLTGPCDDRRHVRLRIKLPGRRSVVGRGTVDVYTQEWSILYAIHHLFRDLEQHESIPSASQLAYMVQRNLDAFAQPF